MFRLPSSIMQNFQYEKSQKTSEGLTVVIPIRGTDRQKSLDVCIKMIEKQCVSPIEIIVSEEDAVPKIQVNSPFVKHVFTVGSTDFNKSRAINAGVMKASYRNVCMNDVDIIAPSNFLSTGISLLTNHDACFLCKEIYYMSEIRSGYVWSGRKRSDYFNGGNIFFSKDAFIRIGGMCEKFVGYGSEDCEFWTRLTSLTKFVEQRDFALLHLPHNRKHQFSQNADLYSSIINTPMNDRVAELVQDLEKYK